LEWFGNTVEQLVHHFGARFYTEEAIVVEGPDFLIHLVAEHWLEFQQG
jgi:hypothetical protein